MIKCISICYIKSSHNFWQLQAKSAALTSCNSLKSFSQLKLFAIVKMILSLIWFSAKLEEFECKRICFSSWQMRFHCKRIFRGGKLEFSKLKFSNDEQKFGKQWTQDSQGVCLNQVCRKLFISLQQTLPKFRRTPPNSDEWSPNSDERLPEFSGKTFWWTAGNHRKIHLGKHKQICPCLPEFAGYYSALMIYCVWVDRTLVPLL